MKSNTVINKCIFLLGIFTTIQLLEFLGITAFNILLMMTAILGLIIKWNGMKIDSYFIICVASTIMTLMHSTVATNIGESYRRGTLMGAVLYIFVLIIYLLMNTNYKYAMGLLKGFKISCYMTLIWCYLQVLFFYVFKLDLNAIFFGNILRIAGAKGAYNDGSLIPSGFYSHRAILIPSILFLFFSTSNIYVIGAIILIALMSKSVTIILGLSVAIGLRICYMAGLAIQKNKCSRKKMLICLIIILTVCVVFLLKYETFSRLFSYVIIRITDSTSNKADNSSVVHFLYYKNFYEILKKENLFDILVGTGFGTSGQHYTWFNGQYAWMASWVVESDYINIILGQGVFGFLLWLYMIIKASVKKNGKLIIENVMWIMVILFMGVMYNIQFNWFIVVELAILTATKNNINVFDWTGKKTGRSKDNLEK